MELPSLKPAPVLVTSLFYGVSFKNDAPWVDIFYFHTETKNPQDLMLAFLNSKKSLFLDPDQEEQEVKSDRWLVDSLPFIPYCYESQIHKEWPRAIALKSTLVSSRGRGTTFIDTKIFEKKVPDEDMKALDQFLEFAEIGEERIVRGWHYSLSDANATHY